MTLEEAQIAWLQADTDYKIYLAKRGTIMLEYKEEDRRVMEEEKELEVAFPKLRPVPKKVGSDMPW